jgi:hypothetical protein
VQEVPGAVDPKTTSCLTPPRPVLWCKSSDGSEKNQTCSDEGSTAAGLGGALGTPSTACIYDWNIPPIGQQLWQKHPETYEQFPPLQAPESDNLDQILSQIKIINHPSD